MKKWKGGDELPTAAAGTEPISFVDGVSRGPRVRVRRLLLAADSSLVGSLLTGSTLAAFSRAAFALAMFVLPADYAIAAVSAHAAVSALVAVSVLAARRGLSARRPPPLFFGAM